MELTDKMILDKARENGDKNGKAAELDFGAGAEWVREFYESEGGGGKGQRSCVCSSGASGEVSGGQQDGGGFLSGYLSVVQFLVVGHGMDSIAEEAMRESGFTYEQFIDAQKRTVFESGRMNEVIKNAFGEG